MKAALREDSVRGKDCAERQVHSGETRKLEPVGKDTNNGVGRLIQPDCGSYDTPITAERVTPQGMREDGHRCAAGSLLIGREQAAEQRRASQYREELVRDKRGAHPTSAVMSRHEGGRSPDIRQSFKDVALRAPIAERRVRPQPIVPLRVLFPDTQQAVGG